MTEDEIQILNEKAMQIILYAGNARALINEVIESAINEDGEVQRKLKEAHEELLKAHKIQTQIIQGAIYDSKQSSTLLFVHAQDTVMTVNSEYNITQNILKLFNKLKDGK